jgi:hypothetical protein
LAEGHRVIFPADLRIVRTEGRETEAAIEQK